MLTSVAVASHQTGVFEDSQVSRDRWQRNTKRLGQLGHAGPAVPGKTLKNSPTSRVRQSRKNRRNPFVFVNQRVKYIWQSVLASQEDI